MKEEQSLHEKHPWSLLNDLSEQIEREAKRNNKIQRTCFSAHKKPFFIWKIIELAACPSWRKILGIVTFYSFETRHFKKGWPAKKRSSNEQILKNVSAEINSDVGEIFCGHSGQIPFTRRARGEIWKLCRSAWILILHEGGALAQKKQLAVFLILIGWLA